jgi:hypothetical protein
MKKASVTCFGAFVMMLVLFAPASGEAKPLAASPQPTSATTLSPATTSPAKIRLISFRGIIASVDQKTKTFTVAGKEKSRYVRVTDKTIITKLGVPATMKDIIDNEEVRGICSKDPNGLFEAKTVKLGPLTEAEKAAEKSYKETRVEKKVGGSPAASPTASISPGPKS